MSRPLAVASTPRRAKTARPWPPYFDRRTMPCACPPDAERWCDRDWTRCNVRLLAIRRWQWAEEERRGIPHPPGAENPGGER